MYKKKSNIKNIPPKQLSHNNVTVESPSILDSMKQGLGFGFGSAIGHKAVDSIFNSSENKTESKEPVNILSSSQLFDLYNKCLEEKSNNINCIDIINKIP
jgi:hypothetical protein